jgi:PAS domain S-box-containing protein
MRQEHANGASDLRRRAEEMLRKQPADLDKIAPEEIKHLLHELQVHQIELEMQNEEMGRLQQELLVSREKYFDLYDLAPVGYLTISEKGLIVEANLTVVNLLGLERDYLISKPVTRFIVKEDQDLYYLHRKQLLETQAPQICELRMMRKGGAPFWARIEAIVARGSNDDALLFRTTVSDITKRKRAEEERLEMERRLQQTQKLESLGLLAGGVAHDFNNLLMAILGHADLALQEVPPMSPVRERIQEIIQASRRAAGLCLQMLAYVGKGQSELKRVDLPALVEEMTHLLKTSINKKAILNLNFEQGLPPIQADANQIRQIVMNLIINASEAIGERGGVITVSIGARESDLEYLRKTCLKNDLPAGLYVYLEVSDTGCGMDEETLQRIFEPFFTTKFTGRGLGLAAALGLVQTHNGALCLQSAPGKGTTFTVLFPALPVREEVRADATGTSTAAWQGSGTVLLVDDEASVRHVVRMMIEYLGFSVLTAADGRQALDLYRERGGEITLVVLDMTMPRLDGVETFRELRRIDPKACVILSSGYAEEDVVSQLAGKGLSGFIQKPYTLDKLRASLSLVISDVKSRGKSHGGGGANAYY